METKSIHENFSDEEMEFLRSKGNLKMNSTLLRNFPRWGVDPSIFRLYHVRQ